MSFAAPRGKMSHPLARPGRAPNFQPADESSPAGGPMTMELKRWISLGFGYTLTLADLGDGEFYYVHRYDKPFDTGLKLPDVPGFCTTLERAYFDLRAMEDQ